MANPQLINYVRLQSKLGVSEGDIRIGLIPGGWSDEEITQAFLTVRSTEATAVPKMPIKGEENTPIVVLPELEELAVPEPVAQRKSSMVREVVTTGVLYAAAVSLGVIALSGAAGQYFAAKSIFVSLFSDDAHLPYLIWLFYPIGIVLVISMFAWIAGKRVYSREGRPVHALLFGMSLYVLLILGALVGTLRILFDTVILQLFNLEVYNAAQGVFTYLMSLTDMIIRVGALFTIVALMVSFRQYPSQGERHIFKYLVRTFIIISAVLTLLQLTHTLNIVGIITLLTAHK